MSFGDLNLCTDDPGVLEGLLLWGEAPCWCMQCWQPGCTGEHAIAKVRAAVRVLVASYPPLPRLKPAHLHSQSCHTHALADAQSPRGGWRQTMGRMSPQQPPQLQHRQQQPPPARRPQQQVVPFPRWRPAPASPQALMWARPRGCARGCLQLSYCLGCLRRWGCTHVTGCRPRHRPRMALPLRLLLVLWLQMNKGTGWSISCR